MKQEPRPAVARRERPPAAGEPPAPRTAHEKAAAERAGAERAVPERAPLDRAPRPETVGPPSPENWEAFGRMLADPATRILRDPARSRFLTGFRDIETRERALDDRLFLGIVGGTGVGKSTLINAIAGTEISKSGDRRPTTDRVIVYRHRNSTLPDDLPAEDLAQPEAVHQEAGLEKLVVLDFPDFDSVEADHASILLRFLPRLDVVLVVADEEKYADLRLFQLLRALPQASGNVHFLLNKIDRLEARYQNRGKAVAQEILDDFAAKLAAHAALDTSHERLVALSALAALRRRQSGVAEGLEGDFPRVLSLLEGYQAEKRRRAAKSANIAALKAALAEEARAAGLNPDAVARAAASKQAIARRADELSQVLRAIPTEPIGSRERRRLHGEAMTRAREKLPFPLSALALLAARKLGGAPPRGEELEGLVRAHYRPHAEALRSADRELRAEVEEVAGDVGAAPAGASLKDLSTRLEREIAAGLFKALRWTRARGWILTVVLVLGAFWFALHGEIAELARRLAAGQPIEWAKMLGGAGASLIAALSPTFIIGFLVLVAIAYGTLFLFERRRVHAAVESALWSFEAAVRTAVRADQDVRFRRLVDALSVWEKERLQLARLLSSASSPGRPPPGRGQPSS